MSSWLVSLELKNNIFKAYVPCLSHNNALVAAQNLKEIFWLVLLDCFPHLVSLCLQ